MKFEFEKNGVITTIKSQRQVGILKQVVKKYNSLRIGSRLILKTILVAGMIFLSQKKIILIYLNQVIFFFIFIVKCSHTSWSMETRFLIGNFG